MEKPPLPRDEGEFPGVAKAVSLRLALKDYEDIFSGFDPRPYAERMLSDDFLYELKRAALGLEESGISLTLQVPKGARDSAQERVLLDRLRGHFRRHHRRLEEKRRQEKRTGAWMVLLGVALMFAGTWVLFRFERTFFTSFGVVLLEPAGWFTFWEGLDLLVMRGRSVDPELDFYRKMSGAKLSFSDRS